MWLRCRVVFRPRCNPNGYHRNGNVLCRANTSAGFICNWHYIIHYHHVIEYSGTGSNEKNGGSKRMNKKTKNAVFYGIIGLLSALALISLIMIVGFILIKGLPGITPEFLTQSPSKMGKEGGILPIIIGTLYVTLVALVIATPIGVAAAI